jgi:hypothetical protein
MHNGQVGACRITVEEAEVNFFENELTSLFEQLSVRNAVTMDDLFEDIEEMPAKFNQSMVDIRHYVQVTAQESGLEFIGIPMP